MKAILFSVLSGLLLILCFPRYDIEYLAWIAMVPLLIAIKDKNLKSAFGLCLIAGILFYTCVFYYFSLVKGVSLIDFALVVLYLSLCYFGLFGFCLNLVSRRTILSPVITAPVLWVSLEYVRSYAGIVSHPMMLMGHSQYLNLPIIQISSFTGVYGVSFLIIMVNVAVCEIIHNRSNAFKPIIATIIVSGISLIYGFGVITKEPVGDNVRISVAQPNIPTDVKWKHESRKQNLKKMMQMTREIERKENPSLIVWPETAVQGSFRNELYLSNTISSLTKEIGTRLLFGNAQHPKHGSRELRKEKKYNSAFLISPEGKIEGQYNKIHLLPFAEYLPYKDSLPWPSKYVSSAGNFISGDEYTIFNHDEARFGTIICWESFYPELFRQFVKRGADFMINITNEGLLGEDHSYKIMAQNVFRTVENRVSLVRCGNTGISCFIDPYGDIMGSVHDCNGKKVSVEGHLTMEVPLSHERTFYTVYGDVFIYMNMTMAVLLIGLSFFRNIRF